LCGGKVLDSKNTKSLIIKTAEELILSYGYQGFSYNDIASIIKIRKSSIHYHYPAKEDLGIVFIDRYSRMFALWTKRLGNISYKEQLSEFCKMYSELSRNCTRICPIGMVAAEYHNMPDKIQHKAEQLILQVEKWLVSMLTAGIKGNEFNQNIKPEETSHQIIYVMSGALKMARIFKDLNRLTDAQQTLKEQIFLKSDGNKR